MCNRALSTVLTSTNWLLPCSTFWGPSHGMSQLEHALRKVLRSVVSQGGREAHF